uniref:(California timema) hypothetical protein n=1 Tax=Timema californicum TaxID=61474 RepID=A0A7R9JBX9_TIMCA|nr:unnamed protein product [Timema californicum]
MNTRQRVALLKTADKIHIDSVYECAYNILKERVPLDKVTCSQAGVAQAGQTRRVLKKCEENRPSDMSKPGRSEHQVLIHQGKVAPLLELGRFEVSQVSTGALKRLTKQMARPRPTNPEHQEPRPKGPDPTTLPTPSLIGH